MRFAWTNFTNVEEKLSSIDTHKQLLQPININWRDVKFGSAHIDGIITISTYKSGFNVWYAGQIRSILELMGYYTGNAITVGDETILWIRTTTIP